MQKETLIKKKDILLKLFKYYFFRSLFKRNFFFLTIFPLIIFFLSFAAPLFFYSFGAKNAAAKETWSYAVNRTQNEGSTRINLEKNAFILEDDFFSVQNRLHGIDPLFLDKNIFDLLEGREKHLEDLKEKISKQQKILEENAVAKKKGDAHNCEKEELKLKEMISEYEKASNLFKNWSIITVPFGWKWCIPFFANKISSWKESFILLMETSTNFFLGFNYTTVLVFSSFFSFLISFFFFKNKNAGEDAMVVLACPGTSRSDILIAKLLAFIVYLTIFAFVGFIYPIIVCWTLFASAGTFFALLKLIFFALIVGPVTFISSIVGTVFFLNNFVNEEIIGYFFTPLICLFFFVLNENNLALTNHNHLRLIKITHPDFDFYFAVFILLAKIIIGSTLLRLYQKKNAKEDLNFLSAKK